LPKGKDSDQDLEKKTHRGKNLSWRPTFKGERKKVKRESHRGSLAYYRMGLEGIGLGLLLLRKRRKGGNMPFQERENETFLDNLPRRTEGPGDSLLLPSNNLICLGKGQYHEEKGKAEGKESPTTTSMESGEANSDQLFEEIWKSLFLRKGVWTGGLLFSRGPERTDHPGGERGEKGGKKLVCRKKEMDWGNRRPKKGGVTARFKGERSLGRQRMRRRELPQL